MKSFRMWYKTKVDSSKYIPGVVAKRLEMRIESSRWRELDPATSRKILDNILASQGDDSFPHAVWVNCPKH